MSFIKRLWNRSSRSREASIDSDDGGEEGRRKNGRASPSNSSPSHKAKPHTTTTTVSVKTPTNRNVAQVLPGLLLGTQEFSQDFNGLQRYKVTHILNVTTEVECSFPDKFIYKRIPIADLPSTRIVPYFDEAFEFINECRAQGGCVLSHCYYGNSRSASFVIAYLIATEQMRYREALEYLHILRPDVHPNDGFERQLKAYELEILCR